MPHEEPGSVLVKSDFAVFKARFVWNTSEQFSVSTASICFIMGAGSFA